MVLSDENTAEATALATLTSARLEQWLTFGRWINVGYVALHCNRLRRGRVPRHFAAFATTKSINSWHSKKEGDTLCPSLGMSFTVIDPPPAW